MIYPKQLISALSKQVNKKLVDYFELENRRYMEAMMRTGFGEMLDEAWKRQKEIFRKRYKKVMGHVLWR